MFTFGKPSAERIRRFLASQADEPFTYADIGATRAGPAPPGFVRAHERYRVGEGEAAFRAAAEALRRWAHFPADWAELHPPGAPVEPGQIVAVVARFAGIWWLNACRVVYVIDEPTRSGFGYGTLSDHAESGEERFLVEWDRATGEVWYDIFVFFKARRWSAWFGYPLLRRVVRRFRRESAAALARAVKGET